MAFTVTFPSTGVTGGLAEVSRWLHELGEAFDAAGPDTIALRGLPIRLVFVPGQHLHAHIDVTANVSLARMVDVLFELSVLAGADVRLAGHGPVNRPVLWMSFADEQDRVRIAGAVIRAQERGREDILHRLWAVIGALRPGHDDRWEASRQRIVELREVGSALGVDEARWHAQDPKPGDLVGVPVEGALHTLVWRWFADAYPGVAEDR